VEVTLPPNASASVSLHTRNGDIVSDYPVPSMDGENKSATITIGSGGAKISLTTDNGDLHIKKGSTAPPPPPSVSAAPRAQGAASPASPAAPHLKAPKSPQQPVSQ
jgi:hypothetical protein